MLKRLSLLLLLGTAACTISTDGWIGETRYADFSQSEALAGEEGIHAKVQVKVGQMEVGPSSPENLYEVELHYNELAFKPKIDFRREAGDAYLDLGLSGEGKSFSSLGKNITRLRINPDVPLDLRSDTGVGESTIDLTGMKTRSLWLQTGVGEATISMLEPNRIQCGVLEVTSGVGALSVVGLGNFSFREFRFRGGIGGTELDFSGEWKEVGDVRIEVGVGGVEIRIPRDIGVEMRVSKGFFSEFEMPGFSKQGDIYYSDNIDRVEKVVQFNVKAGIGGVEVRWL
jgi:hypothetical protein